MSRTCGRCKGSGYIYGKLSVWDMAQGRGSNFGEYPCPVCSGSGNNPNWLETNCRDCHKVIEYHVDWTNIPDLCPECREKRKNQWKEKPCKHCRTTIRYNTTWTNIPEYCKDCNLWLNKPCESCGNPVRYKIYWENPPRICQSCKNEYNRDRGQHQRRDRDFSLRPSGGSSVPNGPNEMARNAARTAGLNAEQRDKLHREIGRMFGTLTYQEILILAYEIKFS